MYKDPPVPRRLVGESQIPPGLSPAYLGSSKNVSRIGLTGEIRTGSQAGFQLCRQNVQEKILKLLSLPAFPVREFTSLIGLLTATEKQVHLGRLHMRPIQWHLKNNWRVTESLEKVPAPPSTMVARKKRTHRPTITPNKTCSANIYRCIKRRLGPSLRRAHCKRNMVPSGK